MNRMYVLVGLRQGEDGHARVVRYGPTSERRELLESYDMNWPASVERVAVLPVLPGALLRVDQRAADNAL